MRLVGDDGKLRRVSKDLLLPVGARILVPRRLIAEHGGPPHSAANPTSGKSAQLGCDYHDQNTFQKLGHSTLRRSCLSHRLLLRTVLQMSRQSGA